MAFMRQLRLRLRCAGSSLPPLLPFLVAPSFSSSSFHARPLLGVDARCAHVLALEARSRAFSGPLRSAIPLSRFLTQVAEYIHYDWKRR